MKILLSLWSAASLAYLIAITASDFACPAAVPNDGKKDDGVARKMDWCPAPKRSFAGPAVFNAHARSKVVQSFDTYRTLSFVATAPRHQATICNLYRNNGSSR